LIRSLGYVTVKLTATKRDTLQRLSSFYGPRSYFPPSDQQTVNVAYMVKFEVETTGVADRISVTIASPQRRRGRQTVSTLNTSTTPTHLPTTSPSLQQHRRHTLLDSSSFR